MLTDSIKDSDYNKLCVWSNNEENKQRKGAFRPIQALFLIS